MYGNLGSLIKTEHSAIVISFANWLSCISDVIVFISSSYQFLYCQFGVRPFSSTGKCIGHSFKQLMWTLQLHNNYQTKCDRSRFLVGDMQTYEVRKSVRSVFKEAVAENEHIWGIKNRTPLHYRTEEVCRDGLTSYYSSIYSFIFAT